MFFQKFQPSRFNVLPPALPIYHEIEKTRGKIACVCMSISTLFKEGNANQKTDKAAALVMKQLQLKIYMVQNHLNIALLNLF